MKLSTTTSIDKHSGNQPPPPPHKGGLSFSKLVEMGEVQTLLLEIGVEVGFEMVGFMIFLIYFLLFGL